MGHPTICRGAVICLCAAAVTGCGPPLCPAAFHPAQIAVRLAPDWTLATGRVVTVSCPPGDECGFLDGPVIGPADGELSVATFLRPPEVVVTVTEPDSTAVALEVVLVVDYQPDGRQTHCGGDARAALVVPVD